MNKARHILIIVGLVLLFTVVFGYLFHQDFRHWLFRHTEPVIDEGISSNDDPENVSVAAKELTVPWEVAVLSDGDLLVTERPGTVKRIGHDEQVFEIPGVQHRGEGGLLGLALHPDFADNRFVYLYLTTANGSGLVNRVERYKYEDGRFSSRQVIIENIPGAAIHDGGRLAFGPDGLLYITTGDAGTPRLAQDTSSLAGKILRLTADGSVPADNPFNNAVYSYGHRNPQGLVWDDQGRLWATEHGRSGLRSGLDELNLIERGANYGWPVIEGDETHTGMRMPVVHSGPADTWAPADLAYHGGSLFFAGLRGQTLYQARIEADGKVSLRAHFQGEYGRLRAVTAYNNYLLVSTSNTDGRGQPEQSDDRILRVSTEFLNR